MDDTDLQELELLPNSVNDANEHTNKHKKEKKSVNVKDNTNSSFKDIQNIILGSQQQNKELSQVTNKEEAKVKTNEVYNITSLHVPNGTVNEAQEQASSINPDFYKFRQNMISTLNLKSGYAPNEGLYNEKQVGKLSNPEGLSGPNIKQDLLKLNSISTDTPCNKNEETTDSSSTCKITTKAMAHEITTCCKTTLQLFTNTKSFKTTTLRAVVANFDELQMANFGLTIAPLRIDKKKRPLSDPEFIHFGNLGKYGIVDESNGTIIDGQAAIDFLEFSQGKIQREKPNKLRGNNNHSSSENCVI